MQRQDTTSETINIIKEAQTKPLPDDITKAWTQPDSPTTGINAYDLAPAAHILYPVNTPLRNMIPRVVNGVGTASNWRSITAVNSTKMSGGLQERDRGGIISTNVVEHSAKFAGLGFDDYVTFEADFASKGYQDVKALAVEGLLRSLMMYEEQTILGGLGTYGLGTTPTPTLTDGAGGGNLGAATYGVICVALTLEGMLGSPAPSSLLVGGSIPGQVSRTNADGTTTVYGGGSALQSARAAIAATGSVKASVAPVKGAVAYAWFLGTTSGTERLTAITTINSVSLTDLNGSGQLASAIPNAAFDNSQNQYVFDGLFAQIAQNGSGASITTLPTGTPGVGTKLTSDGAGGVVEIETALRKFWDDYRLAPTHMFVSSQEAAAITSLVLKNNGVPLYHFNAGDNNRNSLSGGSLVSSYLNRYTYAGNQNLQITMHPNMPAGTILFYTDRLPYALSNVSNPVQMKCRRDYYQIEWVKIRRSYDFGTYVDELLQVLFPPAFGILNNIAPQ